MCADIHDGREQNAPYKGPNTDEPDQLSPYQLYSACNARPVHTDVPGADVALQKLAAGRDQHRPLIWV